MALCAAGAWISAELVKEQAGPWPSHTGSPRWSGLCGTEPDGKSGCAAVLNSDWSAVDFNVPTVTRALTIRWSRVVVPIAFSGLAYFVFLGIWHAFAGPARAWGRWYLIPLVTAVGGAAGSVLLLWVMFFELGAPCRWCVATHALNGLLLVCILSMWPPKRPSTTRATIRQSETGFVGQARPRLAFAAALRVTGFAVLVIAGLWVYRTAKLDIRREVAKLLPYRQFVEELENNADFLLREYHAQPTRPLPARLADDGAESRFSDATIVIFSDFYCRHCACFASKWKREFRQYWQSPLCVSFRHFPLCKDCNRTVTGEGHAEACRAAHAAEAARLQGGEETFWRMHDLLFAQHRRLATVSYADLAMQIGLDGDKLVADMESAPVEQAVEADVALAAELGVTGTPAVFLNGRRVPRLCLHNSVFWEAIAAELWSSSFLSAAEGVDEQQTWELSADSAFANGTVNP